MIVIALWLKSKLFNSGGILLMVLLGLVAIIVVPNLEQIKGKLGFETKASLKATVQAQDAAITHLEAANLNLVQTVAVIEQVAVIKEAAVEQHVEVKEVVKEEVKKVIKVKHQKVKQIKSKHPPEQRADAISRVQIAAIWERYCDFNTHSSCGA